MIDAAIMDTLVRDCVDRENFVETMYLDRRGLVTVGIGNMLPSVDAALRLPFRNAHDERVAPAAVSIDFRRVQSMPHGLPASAYASPGSPRLRFTDATALCERRISEEYLPALRGLSLDVDAFPTPAVRALVAMAYCLGVHGLAGFPILLSRCRRLDFAGAALQCDMKGARAETNAKHERWFRQAAQELRDAKRDSS